MTGHGLPLVTWQIVIGPFTLTMGQNPQMILIPSRVDFLEGALARVDYSSECTHWNPKVRLECPFAE